MKILITGANGFLGYYLCERLLQSHHEVIATSKGACRLPFSSHKNFTYISMDFTNPFPVHDVFAQFRPDTVLHAGAMCKPDDCEQQQWPAYVTNVEGTVNLLLTAEEYNCFFVFVSTDFVFDGTEKIYREDDTPNPVNFYGKTKAEGEDAVKEYPHDWAIVRTVMVYGNPQGGKGNILSVVKGKLEKGEPYQVFDDQTRTPTYVEDLVKGIVLIIEKKAKGIWHLSGMDILTPWQMALQLADHLQLDKSLIQKVTAAEFIQLARRPTRTIFDIGKAVRELGYKPISFSEGLKKTFRIANNQ